MKLMQCKACGGKMVMSVATQSGVCVFCGQTAQELESSDTQLPTPKRRLRWEVKREDAGRQFRQWAKASWWRPQDLRQAKIEVRELYIPAWCVQAQVQSHWTGLQTAMTASGKRPASGVDHREVFHLVAASGGLSPEELLELRPFEAEKAQSWDEKDTEIPFEPPVLTQRRAQAQAREEINELQRARIAQERGLLSCRATSVLEVSRFELDMLPVYIGVFRYRDKPWRFLVNAQTGEVVGKAPLDRWKVAMVIFISIMVIGLMFGVFVSAAM